MPTKFGFSMTKSKFLHKRRKIDPTPPSHFYLNSKIFILKGFGGYEWEQNKVIKTLKIKLFGFGPIINPLRNG